MNVYFYGKNFVLEWTLSSLEEAYIRRCKDDRYIVIAAYLSSTIFQRRMTEESSFCIYNNNNVTLELYTLFNDFETTYANDHSAFFINLVNYSDEWMNKSLMLSLHIYVKMWNM